MSSRGRTRFSTLRRRPPAGSMGGVTESTTRARRRQKNPVIAEAARPPTSTPRQPPTSKGSSRPHVRRESFPPPASAADDQSPHRAREASRGYHRRVEPKASTRLLRGRSGRPGDRRLSSSRSPRVPDRGGKVTAPHTPRPFCARWPTLVGTLPRALRRSNAVGTDFLGKPDPAQGGHEISGRNRPWPRPGRPLYRGADATVSGTNRYPHLFLPHPVGKIST